MNTKVQNLHISCTICPNSECEKFALEKKLDCRFNLKKLLRFVLSFFFIIISGSVALIAYGFMKEFCIFLAVFVAFAIIFFNFWEIRILCSHCPYYAENKKTLHCNANYGCLKLWKYHPEPMSISEKVQLIIGFILLAAIVLTPSAILAVHEHFAIAAIPVIGLIIFIFIIAKYHCTECVNFSCPFNRVPKHIAEEFIKRNPAMLEAWKKIDFLIYR